MPVVRLPQEDEYDADFGVVFQVGRQEIWAYLLLLPPEMPSDVEIVLDLLQAAIVQSLFKIRHVQGSGVLLPCAALRETGDGRLVPAVAVFASDALTPLDGNMPKSPQCDAFVEALITTDAGSQLAHFVETTYVPRLEVGSMRFDTALVGTEPLMFRLPFVNDMELREELPQMELWTRAGFKHMAWAPSIPIALSEQEGVALGFSLEQEQEAPPEPASSPSPVSPPDEQVDVSLSLSEQTKAKEPRELENNISSPVEVEEAPSPETASEEMPPPSYSVSPAGVMNTWLEGAEGEAVYGGGEEDNPVATAAKAAAEDNPVATAAKAAAESKRLAVAEAAAESKRLVVAEAAAAKRRAAAEAERRVAAKAAAEAKRLAAAEVAAETKRRAAIKAAAEAERRAAAKAAAEAKRLAVAEAAAEAKRRAAIKVAAETKRLAAAKAAAEAKHLAVAEAAAEAKHLAVAEAVSEAKRLAAAKAAAGVERRAATEAAANSKPISAVDSSIESQEGALELAEERRALQRELEGALGDDSGFREAFLPSFRLPPRPPRRPTQPSFSHRSGSPSLRVPRIARPTPLDRGSLTDHFFDTASERQPEGGGLELPSSVSERASSRSPLTKEQNPLFADAVGEDLPSSRPPVDAKDRVQKRRISSFRNPKKTVPPPSAEIQALIERLALNPLSGLITSGGDEALASLLTDALRGVLKEGRGGELPSWLGEWDDKSTDADVSLITNKGVVSLGGEEDVSSAIIIRVMGDIKPIELVALDEELSINHKRCVIVTLSSMLRLDLPKTWDVLTLDQLQPVMALAAGGGDTAGFFALCRDYFSIFLEARDRFLDAASGDARSWRVPLEALRYLAPFERALMFDVLDAVQESLDPHGWPRLKAAALADGIAPMERALALSVLDVDGVCTLDVGLIDPASVHAYGLRAWGGIVGVYSERFVPQRTGLDRALVWGRRNAFLRELCDLVQVEVVDLMELPRDDGRLLPLGGFDLLYTPDRESLAQTIVDTVQLLWERVAGGRLRLES